jgi:hypothetical protein
MTDPDSSTPLAALTARPRRSAIAIFRWPVLVGVAAGFGLVAALVADGMWDWAASLSLMVPVVLTAWFYSRTVKR